MFIKRIVKFILHKRKPGETTSLAIRMRVTIKGQTPIDFPLGLKIDEDKWDKNTGRAIYSGGGDAERRKINEINRTITEYEVGINDVLARYELLEKRKPTAEEIKVLFNDIVGIKSVYDDEKEEEVKSFSIVEVFDLYIKTVGKQNNWSKSTYKKNETVKKHLCNAVKKVDFDCLSSQDLQVFVDYLNKKGLKNTTIQKDYQFVRWFLRWARKNGYYNGKADEDFTLRLKGTDGNQKQIIYLTIEELKQLRECEIPQEKKYLQQVRDVFLFCCYTSLRYSDVKALKKSDIIGNSIHIVTQKTTDGIIIELNNKAKEILDKYLSLQTEEDNALPVISNQKYNEYLKELGQMAELNTPTKIVYYKGNVRYDEYYPKYTLLTSHCARRTFVVTALQLGIPVEVIIRWTGHSDYDAMKPYVAIVDELKRKEMDKFNLI